MAEQSHACYLRHHIRMSCAQRQLLLLLLLHVATVETVSPANMRTVSVQGAGHAGRWNVLLRTPDFKSLNTHFRLLLIKARGEVPHSLIGGRCRLRSGHVSCCTLWAQSIGMLQHAHWCESNG